MQIVFANHKRAEILFHQNRISNNVKVNEAIRTDWNTGYGDICINQNNFCGSRHEEVKVLTILRQICKSKEDPVVMRSACDKPDCKYGNCSSKYDSVV